MELTGDARKLDRAADLLREVIWTPPVLKPAWTTPEVTTELREIHEQLRELVHDVRRFIEQHDQQLELGEAG